MKLTQIAMAFLCAQSCAAYAGTARVVGPVDPCGATLYLSGNNADSPVVFNGDLVKQGAGELTVSQSGIHAANGRIVVANGTLVVSDVQSSSPEKPLQVLSKAEIWLDASMPETIDLVEGSSVNVRQWRDVRETGNGTAQNPYSRARAVSFTNFSHSAEFAPDPAGWFPAYRPSSGNELAHVDFGRYSSGRTVVFKNPDGTDMTIGYLRHAFVVLGTHDGHYGFIFNPGGSVVYVPGNYRDLTNCVLDSAFVQSTTGWTTLLSGLFRVDGVVVDPVNSAKPNGGYQLLDIQPGKDGWSVDGLFSHDAIANPTDGYRQGGGRLCEIILFSFPLEESDRLKVEAYLRSKWFLGRTSTLSYAVGVDGALSLASGKLDMPDPVALSVQNAGVYDATADGIVCTEASGSSLVKKGDGELVVSEVLQDVGSVEIQGGTLRIRQGVSSPVSVPSDLSGRIADPSFEAFADVYVGSGGYELNAQKYGWSTYGVNENAYVAKLNPEGGNFNVAGGSFPDGNHVGVLHIRGGLQTSVTIPSDGIYRLSYSLAQRPGYKGHEHRVLIDGIPVAQVKAWDSANAWHRYSLRLPWLSAGEHTLVLSGDPNNSKDSRTANFKVSDSIMSDVTGNIVALVDDFKVDWVEPGFGYVPVNNASFELASFSARGYETNPVLECWEYVSSNQSNRVVLEQTWNGRNTLRPASDGCRIANLYNQVQIGQTLLFPKAGTYTLTFAAATASGDDVASAKGSLRFVLGGIEVAVVAPDEIMKTYGFTFNVPEDGYTAQLVIAGLASGSVVSLDDIRICGTGDEVLAQNTFAYEGWSSFKPTSEIDQGSGQVDWLPSSNKDIQASWGDVAFGFDDFRVGIRNKASVWRSVTFPSSGTYRLSVSSIGRFYRAYDKHLDDPGILTRYSGNEFNVWVAKGGVTNIIGTFGVDDRERFVTHRFLFELPEGGEWVVGFSGLKESERKIPGNSAYHSNGGILDGLIIEKVVAKALPTIPEKVEIGVAEGAKLALDFIGTNAAGIVRYAGRFRTREISARTCPEFVTGTGVLYVQPKGTVIVVR